MSNNSTPNYFESIKNDSNYYIFNKIKNNEEFALLFPIKLYNDFKLSKKYKFNIQSINDKEFLSLIKEFEDQSFVVVVNDTLSGIKIENKLKLIELINLIKNDLGNEELGISTIFGLKNKEIIHLSFVGEVSTNF